MANDVRVKIDLTKAAGKLGFGIPLILEENAAAAKAYTECSSLEDVVSAGFAVDTPVYKTAQLIFMQNNAPGKIAVCAVSGAATAFLADAGNAGKGWRQLLVISGDAETKTAISDIISAVEAIDGKMFYANLPATDTTALEVSGINRTVLFYCTPSESVPVPAAALVGASAGLEPGSFTYKNLILKGIAAQNLKDSEITAIHAKGGITFVAKAGDNVTSEGKTAGGEYIDIVDSEDYIIQQLVYQTQKMLNTLPKVPYDNKGIALLEGIAVNVMKDAFNKGIIAVGEDGAPAYAVNYAMREDTEASDRAARKYLGGKFSFALAGAVHEVEITGEIIV